MNTNITELNTGDLENIQAGRGSTILGYTTAVDPQLQQLDGASGASFIQNIYA